MWNGCFQPSVCSIFHVTLTQDDTLMMMNPYIITTSRQSCMKPWSPNREISLHKMGLHSTCTEQFPGPRSWIKSGISLDYSLWWPLRVLSWGYLKHSPPTLSPAQRRLQGFGPFERFKVQAFRALITHSACTWEAGLVHGAHIFILRDFFFSWLMLSFWSHYTLISYHRTVR